MRKIEKFENLAANFVYFRFHKFFKFFQGEQPSSCIGWISLHPQRTAANTLANGIDEMIPLKLLMSQRVEISLFARFVPWPYAVNTVTSLTA